MNDDLLRTFDTLPKADLSEIDDANDNVPLTHKGGTVDQTDLGITPNFLNCITVLKCDTAANVAKKECTYVGGMPLNGAAEECIGRTIMVIFTNENSVDNPSLSYNKLSGPIVLLNQAADVTVGKNCFGKNTRELFTWDGTAFVMHSNIASNDNASTGLTRFSDGTAMYNKQSVDNQINGALAKDVYGVMHITITQTYINNGYISLSNIAGYTAGDIVYADIQSLTTGFTIGSIQMQGYIAGLKETNGSFILFPNGFSSSFVDKIVNVGYHLRLK